MKTLSFLILIVSSILMMARCECSVSTAKLTDAKICTALNGTQCSSDNPQISGQPEMIYASCILKHAPTDTKVKFTWFYYGETKIEVASVVLNTGERSGNIELYSNFSRPERGWPNGVYEVLIEVQEVDNSKPLTKQFTVQNPV